MKDGKLIAEFYSNAGFTHSQTIMPMVEQMLGSVKTDLADVDLFAVAVGPGSFTGLRIGIAAVKGMAMALDKPCTAISTLYGLAMNVQSFRGYIVPVMDARCNQVYTAIFKNSKNNFARITQDDAMPITELEEKLGELDGAKILVGDGASLCLKSFASTENIYIAPESVMHQHASSLCEIAHLQKTETCTAAQLIPAYLRLPQAQRELNERKERKL